MSLRMSEEKYNEVFEFIKSNLVPKSEFGVSQNEILNLKSALEKTTNDLKKVKMEFEEQKLAMDILQAEKESLEAEKKTFEVKFNEVSLKLKQKANQYELLLKSHRNDFVSKDIEKKSAGTQTINGEMEIVAISSAASSRQDDPAAKTGVKRTNVSTDDVQRTKAKRKKTTIIDTIFRKKPTEKWTCIDCLDEWGRKIQTDYDGDPDRYNNPYNDVPDPKQEIQTFSSFKDYNDHLDTTHDGHAKTKREWPNGDIKCTKCRLNFKYQEHYDEHFQCEHADLNSLSMDDLYELYCENNLIF